MKGTSLDWKSIAGNWPHYQRLAQARWPRLTEQELGLIAARRDALVVHISTLYGISVGAAQMQVESWQGRLVVAVIP